MDVFITKRNTTELKIELHHDSIAAIDGPPTVAINFGTPQQKIISVTDHNAYFLARITKDDLSDSGTVKLVSNFILDSSQLANKDQIIKATQMEYHFDGGADDQDDFEHQYPEDVHPGDPQSKTFRISKSIRIVMIPKLKEDMETLLRDLLKAQS
tara:strand:- start:5858 stop:6322 length:465 start_codon:yes stop_codon:yes gene_type:complete